AVAAVDADLAGAAVEVLQRVGVGGQEEDPGAVEAVRVGLADPLADGEQPRRGRSGRLSDDSAVDVDDGAGTLERDGAPADGDDDPPARACQASPVGRDPGGGAVGSLREPHSQPELTVAYGPASEDEQAHGTVVPASERVQLGHESAGGRGRSRCDRGDEVRDPGAVRSDRAWCGGSGPGAGGARRPARGGAGGTGA